MRELARKKKVSAFINVSIRRKIFFFLVPSEEPSTRKLMSVLYVVVVRSSVIEGRKSIRFGGPMIKSEIELRNAFGE